jgi:hypothetical protein
MPYKYFPIEFSSYEDYVKYLKERGLAIEVTKESNPYAKFMKCVRCGKEIPSYWYYKKNGKCDDYTYIGYCATCEDLARYTGNL